MSVNPHFTPTKQKKLAPKTTSECIREALSHLDASRHLLEAASDQSKSSMHCRGLRRLASGLLSLWAPLNIIAGNCSEEGRSV
jgi:hypothetical protein